MTDEKGKVASVVAVLLVVAALLAFPPTRRIIVLILPLGSGADDFIFAAFALGFAILWFARQLYGSRINKGIFAWLKRFVTWGTEDDE